MFKLQALPEGEWFCSRQCNHIKSALRKLIRDGEKELPESVFNILKMKFEVQGPELNIKWRVLRGGEALDDFRMWLSGAVSIFHVSMNYLLHISFWIFSINLCSDMLHLKVYMASICFLVEV